jgi:hypothetical protein
MRLNRTLATLLVTALISTASLAQKIGDPAPNFTAQDTNGHSQSLDQYRGKYVVLEWTNSGCPFTKKHYESGNMEKLQREWTAKGVVWISVISSAPGHQGYMTAVEENAYLRKMNAAPTAVILDPDGKIGHMYAAKTTPDMYIIDPSGKLIYSGAIDDHPTPDPSDIPQSANYVSAALTQAMAGKPVATAVTRPYGCSVKYAGAD